MLSVALSVAFVSVALVVSAVAVVFAVSVVALVFVAFAVFVVVVVAPVVVAVAFVAAVDAAALPVAVAGVAVAAFPADADSFIVKACADIPIAGCAPLSTTTVEAVGISAVTTPEASVKSFMVTFSAAATSSSDEAALAFISCSMVVVAV